MQRSRHPKYEKSKAAGALRQGEILSNVVQVSLLPNSIATTSPKVKRVKHKYAIVVTPECDLDWDFKARQNAASQHKLVSSILLCSALYSSDLAKLINNDEPPGAKFEKGTTWKKTRQNKEERYHFLEKIDKFLDFHNEGIRSLGIDFKDAFAIPTEFLYSSIDEGITLRRCRLVSPYGAHLNSRFAYFQSRIALPEEHQYTKGEIFLDGENGALLTD